MTRQIALFLLVGALAAATNFGTRILFSHWLPFAAAVVAAYACGMIVAFLLNRRYVFQHGTESASRQLLWFVTVNFLALAQTVVISLLLDSYILPALGWHWHASEIAHATGIAVPMFSSYFGHKHLSFKRREAQGG